jgi:hypothetical protein
LGNSPFFSRSFPHVVCAATQLLLIDFLLTSVQFPHAGRAGSIAGRATWLKQFGVCAGADKVKVVAVNLVDQQPIWLYVKVAVVLPISSEWMVLAPGWQRTAFGKKRD